MVCLLALALSAVAQEPTANPSTFTDPTLGLSFTHPANWTQVKSEPAKPAKGKGKKNGKSADDGSVRFSIPLDNSAPAELTITPASFSGAPEKWQQFQVDANRNLKREVERQWEQEVLGVPMLLTKINYTEEGVQKTTVTGLLYNAAAYKLLFRLTGPTASFDAAQFQFNQALESLRTTSDTLPTAQEPDKPITPPPTPGTPDAKRTLFERPKVTALVAPLALPVKVAGHAATFNVPEGWTIEAKDADTYLLKHSGLKTPVTMKLLPAGTSARPAELLTNAANETLKEFETVDLREDTPGLANKAGNPVLAIWRQGKGPKDPLAAMDAILATAELNVLFSYRSAPGGNFKSERRTIQEMLDRAGVKLTQ